MLINIVEIYALLRLWRRGSGKCNVDVFIRPLDRGRCIKSSEKGRPKLLGLFTTLKMKIVVLGLLCRGLALLVNVVTLYANWSGGLYQTICFVNMSVFYDLFNAYGTLNYDKT